VGGAEAEGDGGEAASEGSFNAGGAGWFMREGLSYCAMDGQRVWLSRGIVRWGCGSVRCL